MVFDRRIRVVLLNGLLLAAGLIASPGAVAAVDEPDPLNTIPTG